MSKVLVSDAQNEVHSSITVQVIARSRWYFSSSSTLHLISNSDSFRSWNLCTMPNFVRKIKIVMAVASVLCFLCTVKYLASSTLLLTYISHLGRPTLWRMGLDQVEIADSITDVGRDSASVPRSRVDDIDSQGLQVLLHHDCNHDGNIVPGHSNALVRKIMPFSVLYVTVASKFSDHCRLSRALVHLNAPQNFSIGLGNNHLLRRVYLNPVNLTFFKVSVLIFRQERILPMLKDWIDILATMRLKLCLLIQSCSHLIDETKPCNIFSPDNNEDWLAFLARQRNYRPCNLNNDFRNDDVHWSIPCLDCGLAETCLWSQAVWTPGNARCSLESTQRPTTLSRLQSTKVIFIGDSTIRGLYFSLLEHLNGSLHSWTKSHSSLEARISQLRDVSIAYSYFPKFWEPEISRLGLSETLVDVTDKLRDTNADQLILVIGGVQWLTAVHVEEIRRFIVDIGGPFTKKFVIIKEHGAGFHVPASFITFKPKKSRTQLTAMNGQLVQEVDRYGFTLLPSYRMTWSRLEEFYPGTCACHFHTVVPVIGHTATSPDKASQSHIRTTLNPISSTPSSHYAHTSYKVIGSIHKTYFDILKSIIHNITRI